MVMTTKRTRRKRPNPTGQVGSIYSTQSTTRTGGRSYTYTIVRYDEYLDSGSRQPRTLVGLGPSEKLDGERVQTFTNLAREFCRKGSTMTVEEFKAALAGHAPTLRILCSRGFGFRLLVEQAWAELGYSAVLEDISKRTRHRFSLERAVFGMVLQHLVDPGSKLRAATWLPKKLFFPEGEGLTSDHYYRALDVLAESLDTIEEALRVRLADLGVSFKALARDTTSTYFETDYDDEEWKDRAGRAERVRSATINEPPLRMRGYSKDHRPTKPQVVVQQVCAEGYIVEHDTLPGNKTDRRVGAEELPVSGVSGTVLAADAGLNSAEIREQLKSRNFTWVLGEGRTGTKAARKAIEGDEGWEPHPTKPYLSYRVVDQGKLRYVVRLNQREREREIHKIARHLEKVWDHLLKDDRAEGHGKRTCALLSSKTLKRYVRRTGENKDRLDIDEEAVIRAQFLAGKSVISTNDSSLTGLEVDTIYRSLFVVEDLFRTLKLELQLRPVRHRLSKRIIAHIFVCVMAANVAAHLRKRTGLKLGKLRDLLESVRVQEIECGGRRFWECVELTEAQREVFELAGYDAPLKRFTVEVLR